eukprot:TRINITY_DN91892_c0_g1_i1.p1 TRINITY_DN91892_c0_g1~~TRINITY_DN91892_c0_g1_i1.p1  ORF type:complete len:377 (+),score=52.62 TRINITY_DN91892_c0_g1_i1:167-1132(+)
MCNAIAPGMEVKAVTAFEAPPRCKGYIPFVEGSLLRVAYVGSEATADAGWLFGHSSLNAEEKGWFPAATVCPFESCPLLEPLGEFRINIEGLAGPVCNIAASPGWSVLVLKSVIESETGIPSREQHLSSVGAVPRVLDDQATLGAEVEAGAEILDLSLVRQNEHMQWCERVARRGCELYNAPPCVRANREAVLRAIASDANALHAVASDLKRDRDVVLAAVSRNGMSLIGASPELRDDREIVLTAVQQDGLALDFAGSRMQSDEGVVHAAIQQNWRAVEFASDELQHSTDICWEAVRQSNAALQYARGLAHSECQRRLGLP